MTVQDFLSALVSPGRSPEIPETADIFGFLIGSWEMEAVLYAPDGQTQRSKGELHAAWVLEGRAIQDLFIFPRRADRRSHVPEQGDRYATTIRTYDHTRSGWNVEFINPAAPETSARLLAHREGQDITMEGELAGGVRIRWRYESITPDSFHYFAERATGDRTWRRYLGLFGRRSG